MIEKDGKTCEVFDRMSGLARGCEAWWGFAQDMNIPLHGLFISRKNGVFSVALALQCTATVSGDAFFLRRGNSQRTELGFGRERSDNVGMFFKGSAAQRIGTRAKNNMRLSCHRRQKGSKRRVSHQFPILRRPRNNRRHYG
jgi:hypothetical protein